MSKEKILFEGSKTGNDLVSPWHPITDPLDLKHLGKLAEECGELSAALARCIIQGLDEAEPVTGKVNRQWLTEEIADVIANINVVQAHFFLSHDAIVDRVRRKEANLKRWHANAGVRR